MALFIASFAAAMSLRTLLLLFALQQVEGWTSSRLSSHHRYRAAAAAAWRESVAALAASSIVAQIAGYDMLSNDHERITYTTALEREGFTVVAVGDDDDDAVSASTCAPVVVVYRWNAAAGMLQLVPSTNTHGSCDGAPRWIPVHQDKETVLISNGWSFLDADESDPVSAFDVDAANHEGLYRPKWGQKSNENEKVVLSSLGYSLTPMTTNEIMDVAKQLSSDLSR